MSVAPNSTLRAVNLSKAYRSGPSELVVFSGLDLTIATGESIAVVGASGAGKSSLLHLLGGLDRPSAGTVFYGDRDIFALGESDLAKLRNREIGFVWQQASLLPEFTALENVAMPLLVRGTPPEDALKSAATGLEEVGLTARAWHRSGEMSGGEQQRVALARALVTKPKVLLADEPTGNLDHRTGDQIAGLLRDLHQAHGLTSVIVTHNLRFARGCHRILQLEEGLFAPWIGAASSQDVSLRDDEG